MDLFRWQGRGGWGVLVGVVGVGVRGGGAWRGGVGWGGGWGVGGSTWLYTITIKYFGRKVSKLDSLSFHINQKQFEHFITQYHVMHEHMFKCSTYRFVNNIVNQWHHMAS